jgi:hypothetical protein
MRPAARFLVACAVLASLIAAGASPRPAGAADAPRLEYVGQVGGTEAFVGIVIRGKAVTAYVCDGRKLARWFDGRLTGRRVRLHSPSGGRIALRIGRDGRARGVLRQAGRTSRRFVAVAARGRAGLFRSDRAVTTPSGGRTRALTGWVRLNDGRVRGATVSDPYRIERPTADITLVLRAATRGTISSPTSGPESGVRVSAAAPSPICRWFTGTTAGGIRRPLRTPGCGMPLTGITPSRAAGPRVDSRPTGFPLSQDALALFADRLDDQFARDIAALLRRAGRPTRAPSASGRARIATRAGIMLQDGRLLDAAESLRRGTPSEVLARTDGYGKRARPHRDQVSSQFPSHDPLAALVVTSTVPRAPLPARRTYLGPWAETSNIVTSGDDWAFDDNTYEICNPSAACPTLFDVASSATRVPAHVRAGFNSSITWDRAHLLAFDIPAGAGRVQVDVDASQLDLDVAVEDCFGSAWGFASQSYFIFEVGDDGVVDPFDDAPVSGGHYVLAFDDDPVLPDGPECLRLSPPVPDPPDFTGSGEGDAVLEFTAPPGGGSYVLAAGVHVNGEVFLGGTALSQAKLGIDKVTVSHG